MVSFHLIGRGLLFPIFIIVVEGIARQVPSPPKITKQPPHEQLFQIADPNSPVTKPVILECEAIGPDVKYTWKKNGDLFVWTANDERLSMQPGRGTLVITTPKDIDEGLYQCFADNMYGIAVSNAVYLRRAELNAFAGDTNAIETIATEGQPLTLNCEPPTGLPPPTIFWIIQSLAGGLDSINNSRITVDLEGDLHFSNVTVSDESRDSYYACSAHSSYRQEYKLGNFVKLKVMTTGAPSKVAPKKQYTSPVDVQAMRGKAIKLSCIYGGTPLPEVRWTKKNSELPTGRYSITDFGKSLKIFDVDSSDEGLYECLVTNGVGSPQSHGMKITVQSEPYWVIEPSDANKAEEETVTFLCNASGIPTPLIQWFVNGTPIANAVPNTRRFVSYNNITIIDLKKEIDTDVYQCNASNVHGYVFANAYVNVLALPPEIVKPPENLTETVEDSQVIISCRVFGAPQPSVAWTKDTHALTGGRFKVLENGDLQIDNVNFADRGEYNCEATNKFGKKNARGHLDIKGKTTMLTPPESLEVRAGDTAVFRCSANSDNSLDVTIKWLREGTFIDYEADPRLYLSNDYSLTVTSLQELDSGTYTCVALTRLDNVTASATLIVQDVPNPPAGITVECKDLNAMVRWRSMGDNRAPILNYIIQHNTSFEPDTWLDLTNKVPPTETSFQVSLSPWVNYTFRVIARNKIGPSLASSISGVCATPKNVPNKNPDNVHGRGTTPTTLVIYWTPMPQIEHNAPGFYYSVQYRRSDLPNEPPVTERITDWRNTTLVVNNQDTYKPYDITVWAHNEIGRANVEADIIRGYSGEAVPSQEPFNFKLSSIVGPKSARFVWDPVPPHTLNGEFKGYKIQTWVAPEIPDDNVREMVVGPNETTAVADIFLPHSENTVRIVAYNGQYNGPPSPVIIFTTPEGVPGPVKSFIAYPLGASALYVVWSKPDEPNGIIKGYNITYRKVVGTELQTITPRKGIIFHDKTTAKISGLEPDTNYRVTIRGYNKEHGEENFAEARTEAVLSEIERRGLSPPGKPKLEILNIAENNVRVRWIPALEKEQSRPGNYFYVQYKRQGETKWERNTDEFNEDFTVVNNLDPGTTYIMRIVSMEGNQQTPSDEEEITTGGRQTRDNTDSISTAGWFVGMMCAIAFLLLVLIIVCVIKRNRGGKYSVHEKEAAQGRDLEKADDGSFNEYSKPVDDGPGGKGSQTSLTSSVKGPESETDSMAEYGDGETAKFTEDGSFIGQYGSDKKKKEPDQEPDTTSPSALSTFV